MANLLRFCRSKRRLPWRRQARAALAHRCYEDHCGIPATLRRTNRLREARLAQAATLKEQPKTAADETRELTDGFHLVIDALKLNGLNTIYGVPGIPITDFGRMAQ